METETRTQQFLTLLIENRTSEARRLLGHVEYELSLIPSNLIPSQQIVVKELNAILLRLHGGYDGSAIAKAKNALVKFAQYRMHSLIKNVLRKRSTSNYDPLSGRGDSYVDMPVTIIERCRATGREKTLSEFVEIGQPKPEKRELWTYPGINERDEEAELMKERTKFDNNAKTDFNTPALVAEKFTELYFTEWTEAFQALVKQQLQERNIIQLLLDIVETAYKCCEQEATRQIHAINSAFLDILEFGENENNFHELPQKSSLVAKYRKDMAATAVHRLREAFYEKKLKDICNSKFGTTPDKNGVISRYSNKVVEVTWWICIQSPPVYMVPTIPENVDAKHYKPYSRSNASGLPDYFVWPALRFHDSGDILLKGVVRYT